MCGKRHLVGDNYSFICIVSIKGLSNAVVIGDMNQNSLNAINKLNIHVHVQHLMKLPTCGTDRPVPTDLFHLGTDRPVSSVGRVPDYRARGCGFKPRPDHHSGSLKKIIEEKSAAFVMTSANG